MSGVLRVGPDQPVDPNSLNRILKWYTEWLKSKRGMRDQAHAKQEREQRVQAAREWIEQTMRREQWPLKRLYDHLKGDLEGRAGRLASQGEIDELPLELRYRYDFLQFLEDEFDVLEPLLVPQDEAETVAEELAAAGAEEIPAGVAAPPPIFGRVALTANTPASPGEFTFWIEDRPDLHLEPGHIVTAETVNSREPVYGVGLVTDLWVQTDLRDPADAFYAHHLGSPHEEPATAIPSIMVGRAEVIWRSDDRAEPIRGAWSVRFSTSYEVVQAYSSDIHEDHRVLAGFVHNPSDRGWNLIPVCVDSRYVAGYEAAHVNISGASGVATKTSYALFLLQAMLASQRDVAVIAFNVKEADLMNIDNLPESWDELTKWSRREKWRDDVRMWLEAHTQFNVDPIKLRQDNRFRFYAPVRQSRFLSIRQEGVTRFLYGLSELREASPTTFLYPLLDEQDLDERAQAVLASLAQVEAETFEKLLNIVNQTLREGRDWVTVKTAGGEHTHHKATVAKVQRALQHAIDHQLSAVVSKADASAEPIPLDQLKAGDFWVVDITALGPKAQRLVFQWLLSALCSQLEKAKYGGNESDFPKRVVVFVDELNKFVPAGRAQSPIKDQVVDITSRGRSIGLSLLGAQQLASRVDEEVIANTSTFLVGRTHPVEISKPPYGWLAEGLKRRAVVLEKGQMLLWHTLHRRPVLVRFPRPLHRLLEEVQQDEQRRE